MSRGRWKRPSPYHLLSPCGEYTISKASVEGQWVYLLHRGGEVIGARAFDAKDLQQRYAHIKNPALSSGE